MNPLCSVALALVVFASDATAADSPKAGRRAEKSAPSPSNMIGRLRQREEHYSIWTFEIQGTY